jgi:hypothetical protein
MALQRAHTRSHGFLAKNEAELRLLAFFIAPAW